MSWQPIETAPRDGTKILIFTDYGTIGVVAWDFNVGAWHDGMYSWFDATHWMPLPPPPEGM